MVWRWCCGVELVACDADSTSPVAPSLLGSVGLAIAIVLICVKL